MKKLNKDLEEKFAEIMKMLGIDLKDPNNSDTPRRLAKLYADEVFANRNNMNLKDLVKSMTYFPNEGYNEFRNESRWVEVKGIKFFSTCAHHWLPFFGEVSVAYIPREHIIGLSKIPRVVKFFSKKPQVQENLGKEIAEFIFGELDPEKIVVRIVARHTCVASRGAENDCETLTEYVINRVDRKPSEYI